MNVIMILIDSLNRNCLEAYGSHETYTPNLDGFAKKSTVFNNHFIGSAPCMPARRELMTGRKEFLWRGWGPIEPFDRHIAIEAQKAGTVTSIVTDHYHYWENSAHGYFEAFNAAKLIRGHELDPFNTEPCGELPEWVQSINQYRPDYGTRYYRNVKDFAGEDDFFSAKTMTEAASWLEKNHTHDKFMLWIESFDVHEPFHIPEPYCSKYTDQQNTGFNCWPPYQDGVFGHHEKFWENTNQEEIDYIRSQYYGKVTMVDHWLGKVFQVMDRHDLWSNTAVIVTSDHGHELGEKKRFGKQPPHYDQCANIPLFIWHPQYSKKSVEALSCAVDIYPTILELLDAKKIDSPHGISLLPLLEGLTSCHREFVTYGEFGAGATITDGEYTYHNTWNENGEINLYSALMPFCSTEAISGKFIPGIDCPVWKIPVNSQKPSIPNLLFERRKDPSQNVNIASDNPQIIHHMKELLKRAMDEEGTPIEQYERLYLGIR